MSNKIKKKGRVDSATNNNIFAGRYKEGDRGSKKKSGLYAKLVHYTGVERKNYKR